MGEVDVRDNGDDPHRGEGALGAPAGLCGQCVHALFNTTRRGTAYLRCGRAATEPRLPKYPQLPVRDCWAFEDMPAGEPQE